MPSPDQSLGWTVPEQSGGSVFQPKHAVLHHTETQCLRDLSLEKGALKVVCCNKRTKSWMGKKSFWLRRTYNTHKIKKRQKKKIKDTNKKSEWFVCMVHDVLGTSPGQQIHWYFTKLSEVSMCALWMSEIGWLAPWNERRREDVWEKRWLDGWCGAGTNVAVDWMGFWGKCSICVSPGGSVRMGQDGSSCLSVWHPDWGGSPKLLRPWVGPEWEGGPVPLLVSDPGTKTPPWSLYDRSFFWCFWCSY